MMKVFRSGSKMSYLAMILLIPVFFLLHPGVACPEESVENALPKEDQLDDELKYLKEETLSSPLLKFPKGSRRHRGPSML